MAKPLTKTFADKLSGIARQQLLAGTQFKQPRLGDIKKSEDLHLGKTRPALKGRFNVPLPLMSGYVDTLRSKIDDPPKINFGHQDEADIRRAKKVTAAWEADSGKVTPNAKWAQKDRFQKTMAIFSGVGIFKFYAESDPHYKANLEVPNYYDFVCEPNGGANLENHLFLGMMNIFRTPSALRDGAASGLYNKKQVGELLWGVSTGEYKENDDIYKNKLSKFQALGFDPETNSYVGQRVIPLVEWCMDHEGERYYMLFDWKSGIWVRCERLQEVFKSNLWPFVSWQTHEDPMLFWSKAPVDDMRPVCEAMHTLFNQALDNRQKKNWGQRAFDASIFKKPKQLMWRPDGLVSGDTKGGIKKLSEGIYEFKTPDVEGTLDLLQFVDNFTGLKTGVTPSAQGATDPKQKVGIYYGDLQQIADRLGLLNKSYSDCWAELGLRYYHGLKEHLTEGFAVKMLGTRGAEMEELLRKDLKPVKDFDITITGGNAEMEADAAKKERRKEVLADITNSELLLGEINLGWTIEQLLRSGEFTDEEIRVAKDKQSEGNQEILAEASEENQDLLTGKKVKPNRGATSGHLQKHIDFAYDNDLDEPTFKRFLAHIDEETPYMQENEERRLRIPVVIPGAPEETPPTPGIPVGGAPPPAIPGTPRGTASRAQEESKIIQP